jgi:hypothetical protein
MNEIASSGTAPAAAPAAASCPGCGTPSREGRLTLRWLLHRARADVAGLERGLLPTVWHLLVAPRRVVEAYLQGAPARYYGPFKFFLIATAATLLLMPDAPFFDQGLSRLLAKRLAIPSEQALGFVHAWNALLYAPMVALLALAMRGFFRARGLNYAEHLVLALYGWSQMLLLGTFSLLAAAGLKSLGIRGLVLLPLLLLAPVYWLWFVGHALRLRDAADWLRAIAALPGAFALFLLGMTLAVQIAAPLLAMWRAAA